VFISRYLCSLYLSISLSLSTSFCLSVSVCCFPLRLSLCFLFFSSLFLSLSAPLCPFFSVPSLPSMLVSVMVITINISLNHNLIDSNRRRAGKKTQPTEGYPVLVFYPLTPVSKTPASFVRPFVVFSSPPLDPRPALPSLHTSQYYLPSLLIRGRRKIRRSRYRAIRQDQDQIP